MRNLEKELRNPRSSTRRLKSRGALSNKLYISYTVVTIFQLLMDASHLRSCVSRYDRFQDAFEHVSTVIDDIYKVWLLVCTVQWECVFLTTPGVCISLQKLSNNTSAQAFLGPENAEVYICVYNMCANVQINLLYVMLMVFNMLACAHTHTHT